MSHLFRVRHKLAPSYLMPNFKLISAAHSHNTRASNHNFHLSRDLSLFSNGFAFTAIKQWNGLPDRIKSITDFRVFKRKLKEFLISQYEWSLRILSNGFVTDYVGNKFYFISTNFLFLYFTLMNFLLKGPHWKQVFDFYGPSFRGGLLQFFLNCNLFPCFDK